MRRPRGNAVSCLIVLLTTIVAGESWTAGEDLPSLLVGPPPAGVCSPAAPWQLYRAWTAPDPWGSEALRSNDEKTRGSAAGIYTAAAPAIVLLHCGESFGTGFLVSPEGWIVTNHHVVADAPINFKTGALVAKVFLGHLAEQMMVLDATPLRALVYKTDPQKDLALLRIESLPKGTKGLPALAVAQVAPTPGSDCLVIGHPRAGLLWTVRHGEIAATGFFPRDAVQNVTTRLASLGKEPPPLTKALAALPARKIWISTCLTNPGDSGAPVLNDKGEVIGVHFGAPRSDVTHDLVLDKFAYHVHLDDLKAFLADRPAQPKPMVPDPWPAALTCQLIDADKDKILDTLMFFVKPNEPPVGLLCDLSQQSSAEFDPARISDPAVRKLWRYQFAYHRLPVRRAFYDTANSGQIDLILSDFKGTGIADAALKRDASGWKAVPAAGQKMLDAALFKDRRLAERFTRFVPADASPAGKATEKTKLAPAGKGGSGATSK
jgi:S1-C subfamily serine protease